MDEKWDWNTVSLEEYVKEKNYPGSWSSFFERQDIQDIFKSISKNMNRDIVIYPPPNLVFRAFRTPLENIKVVILGQDPYHNGNATGLCFSVPVGAEINPSLRNIYNELEAEGFSVNKNGDLSSWPTQGCMMLNTALTVEKSSPESHLHLWFQFTQKVLEYIGTQTKNVAWLLMGAKALEFKKYAVPENGHKIFCTSHPSPFSAHKGFRDVPAFLGSGVFKNINTFLGKEKIIW
jgi:uracil-DNA glycosylase